MSRPTPVDRESITDPELVALIDRCEALGVPDALFGRVLARVPDYAKAILRAMLMSHTEGSVDHRLKEILRIQLARLARDPYFSALRSRRAMAAGLDESTITAGRDNYESDTRFTEADRWALRFADQLYVNPDAIDAAFYEGMKRYYSEAQIMEIGAFVAMHYGMQMFMRTLDARPISGRA